MRAKYQKLVYSKDLWMQCCGKRGKFIHFPFSARDSLCMPTTGRRGLQRRQAVWWGYTLRIGGVETSRPVTTEAQRWQEVYRSGTASSLEVRRRRTIQRRCRCSSAQVWSRQRTSDFQRRPEGHHRLPSPHLLLTPLSTEICQSSKAWKKVAKVSKRYGNWSTSNLITLTLH
jgi:hypothetical protein